MTSLQQLESHIMFRLVLARTLFKSGLENCSTNVDIFNFSHGLVSLHDAVDNFTGAIATHLNINLPQDSKLITTINLIRDHEKVKDSAFVLIGRDEIVQLNTLRNNIKHQGIIPNINHSRTLLGSITSFFQEYSRRYFDLEWEFISLTDLIKKDATKDSVKKVEEMIEQGKYKDALDKLAIIKFQVFEELALKVRLNPNRDLFPPSDDTKKLRVSNNIFPGQHSSWWLTDVYDRARLLEKGIDRNLMNRFEELTANVGFNNAEKLDYILDHGTNWGELNWTREISVFCLDFLVDSIIRNQYKEHAVRQKWIYESHKIKALEDISIYEHKDNKLIHTMLKGKECNAFFIGRKAGQWEIFESNDCFIRIYDDNDENIIEGFFKEGDESKIKFLKTEYTTRDDEGNWVLIKEEEY